MKKAIFATIMFLSSMSLYSDSSIGVRITAPIGNNGVIELGARSDDHRYNNRYKNFNYRKNAYYDDYGYYFGYFDRKGYFFNNIFFLFDSRYTYHDRLHKRGYFRPNHAHYRPYKHHKINNWNKIHKYRDLNRPIYGHYYEKNKTRYYKHRKSKSDYHHRR